LGDSDVIKLNHAIVSSLDKLFDPVTGCLTLQVPQRIAVGRPDEHLRKRIKELGRKTDERMLTPEEAAGYRDIISRTAM
jgi:hypothetical protein